MPVRGDLPPGRLPPLGLLIDARGKSQAVSEMGQSTSFQAQAARFRFSPDSGHIGASRRSATKSADARRGAADDGELRQAAGGAIAARSAVKPRAEVMIG